MNTLRKLAALFFAVLTVPAAAPAGAADGSNYPQPKEWTWIARDFRFSTGEVLPEVRLHYTTIGAPTGEPVLLLHGTTGMAKLWKQYLAELLQTAPKR